MTIEKIRKLYNARPFRPFVMHLADGRLIPVGHPEFLASDPRGRTVGVYQPDGDFDIVDVALVTDLEVPVIKHRRPPPGNKKRSRK